MTKDFILNKEQFLNGTNFDPWYGRIKTALETRKLIKYVNKDMIKYAKENFPKDKEKLQKIEKRNAKTKSIIINNLTDSVYETVKNIENSYDIMSKLKTIYKKEKSITLQEWMNKLQKLKSTKLNEIMSTLFKIKEIFKLMEDTSSKIGELEKVKIMYNSLPPFAKFFIHPTKEYTVEKFFNEINNIITFKIYAGDNDSFGEDVENFYENDIFNNDSEKEVNEITHIKNRNKSHKKSKKYCYICEKSGHTTKECRYNRRTKPRTKNKYIRRNKEHKKELNYLGKEENNNQVDITKYEDNDDLQKEIEEFF